MILQRAILWCLATAGSGLARTLARAPKDLRARQDPTATTDAPGAQSTACGELVGYVDEGFNVFTASFAYECLTSVPFNAAVATRYLRYWNQTLQFQSTLAYLKNPSPGYQQPRVDVLEELARIQQRIDSNFYTNQYAFEADFQLLAYALNDGHVTITSGILSAFTFGSPFEITSVSTDGKELPKLYFTEDIYRSQKENWHPSPIKTINGEDADEYVSRYAALNSWGYVEPHAEWNAVMSNPTLDILGGATVFGGGATFYPGENLTFHFENYTETDNSTFVDTVWVAFYNELANYTGPLTTGGDFYNYFALGLRPDSFNASNIIPPPFIGAEAAPMNWSEASFGAFPENPNVVQDDLGPFNTGVVSGYFYDDISTGVLSIPTFSVISDSIGNFTDAVDNFVQNASNAGLKNVIIDMQRNSGGLTFLAYTTFKSFFPDLTPFAGSRRRITELANVMGSSTTEFWGLLDENDPDQLEFKQQMAAFNWLITNRINAQTGRNFSSWQEYEGPITDNGDTFSLTQQYNLADDVFDAAAFAQWLPTRYLPQEPGSTPPPRPWNPDQIVILTDGLCASACSLLLEMMTRAGVKTVVAGGLPQAGPMQAASGTRGAQPYSADALDSDMDFDRSIDEFVSENVNQTVPEVRDSGLYISYASVNLLDQVRKDETTPLQFKYEAADCRIYYTLANLYNMTRLWHDVAAAFANPSLCVSGSTGFSTTNNTTPLPPPDPKAQRPKLEYTDSAVEHIEFESDPTGGLRDGKGPARSNSIIKCPLGISPGQFCPDRQSICRQLNLKCSLGNSITVNACLPTCTCPRGVENCNSCPGICALSKQSPNKVRGGLVQVESTQVQGWCFPVNGDKLGCPTNPRGF